MKEKTSVATSMPPLMTTLQLYTQGKKTAELLFMYYVLKSARKNGLQLGTFQDLAS